MENKDIKEEEAFEIEVQSVYSEKAEDVQNEKEHVELSDEELEQVAGGLNSHYCHQHTIRNTE